MQALKLRVHVPTDHRISFDLPDDFPLGEAEVVVSTGIPQTEDAGSLLRDLEALVLAFAAIREVADNLISSTSEVPTQSVEELQEAIQANFEAVQLLHERIARMPANLDDSKRQTDFSSWLAKLLDRLPPAPALPEVAFERASIYEE